MALHNTDMDRQKKLRLVTFRMLREITYNGNLPAAASFGRIQHIYSMR